MLGLASFNWHLTLVSVYAPAGLASLLSLCSLFPSLSAPKARLLMLLLVSVRGGVSERERKKTSREEERGTEKKDFESF